MELTITDLKALIESNDWVDPLDPQKGENLLVRTVTMTITGKVVACSPSWLLLDQAAWIADTGRFANAISGGSLGEVEPMGDGVRVARGSIVDVTPWRHDLPTTQK